MNRFAAVLCLFVGSLGAKGAILPPELLHNVAATQLAGEGEGVRLSRVPLELLSHLNAAARVRAFSPAGCEIRFNLGHGSAHLVLRMVEDRAARTRGRAVLAEVYYGNHLAAVHALGEEWSTIDIASPPRTLPARTTAGKGFDPSLIRVLLPYAVEVRVKSLEGDITPPRREQVPAVRYLAYGSSITHGYDAALAGANYPALLARARGWDVINLGFGAGAHLEPELAEWIAQRDDWDVATLELGVNLLGRVDETEFRRRVEKFLGILTAARPEKWIFVIDIIRSGRDLSGDAKQKAFRRVVAECVQRVGRGHVIHMDGEMLLQNMDGLSPDLVHPTPDGFREISARLDHAITVSGFPK